MTGEIPSPSHVLEKDEADNGRKWDLLIDTQDLSAVTPHMN